MRFEEEEDDGKDEDDSGEAEDIHYKDFFDPAEQAAGAAASLGASGTVTACLRSEAASWHRMIRRLILMKVSLLL